MKLDTLYEDDYAVADLEFILIFHSSILTNKTLFVDIFINILIRKKKHINEDDISKQKIPTKRYHFPA